MNEKENLPHKGSFLCKKNNSIKIVVKYYYQTKGDM